MKYLRDNRNFEFVIFFIISLLISFFFYKIFLPAEDATILYRYSENLAETGVISYNFNGSPTEGATDFLWMILLSVFYLIGFNTYFASILINLISLYFIIKLIENFYSLKKTDFFILIFFHLSLTQTYSAILGFSVLFVELILVLVVINYLKGNIFKTLLFSFVGCLVRPDFILFIIIPNLFNLIQNFNLKNLKLYLIFIILGLIYFFLRYSYFDLLFPLPFYVKNQWNILNNLEWGRQIIILLPGIIILFFIEIKKILNRRIIVLIFIIVLATFYYSNQILYQNIGYRFYFYFPILTILILYEIQREYLKNNQLVRNIIILISISSLLINFSQKFNSVNFLTKEESIYNISNELKKVNENISLSLATTEAGLLPYYSKINTVDLFGLNTKKFASKPADGSLFIEREFDLIAINSSITGENCNSLKNLLDEVKDKKLNSSKRSDDWSTFSKNLISGIDMNKYEAYFLVYPKNIFLNRNSEAYKEISEIITNNMIEKCDY